MGKSNDILLELEGHFWWYGETIPEGQYAPPSALPGVLTISEDGPGKLVVTGSLMRSEPIKLDNAGRRAAENNLDTLERRTIAGWVEKDFIEFIFATWSTDELNAVLTDEKRRSSMLDSRL
jgi:hypothetical protein